MSGCRAVVGAGHVGFVRLQLAAQAARSSRVEQEE
jgi:hypothetical protein